MLRNSLRFSFLPVLALAGLLTAPSPASDQVAVYAVVDRVVLTPDEEAPTAIQIYGAFSTSANEPGDHYAPAARGYMYFNIAPANTPAIRAEWADLQRIAGTKQIIGFGAKYTKPYPRLRCATERLAAPDIYITGTGLVKAVPTGNTVSAQITRDLKSTTIPSAPCK